MINDEAELVAAHHAELHRSRSASNQMDQDQMATQRWQMIQAMQNASNLKQENDALKEDIKEISALANTTMIQSEALLRTIQHLRQAWAADAPQSEARKTTMEGLDDEYKNNWQATKEDENSKAERERVLEGALAKSKQSSARRMKR